MTLPSFISLGRSEAVAARKGSFNSPFVFHSEVSRGSKNESFARWGRGRGRDQSESRGKEGEGEEEGERERRELKVEPLINIKSLNLGCDLDLTWIV